MSECCGKTRATRFCPDCGKQIMPDHPLAALLAHLENTARTRKIAAENSTEWARSAQLDSEQRHRNEENIKRSMKSYVKFQRWANELRKLISTDSPTGGSVN